MYTRPVLAALLTAGLTLAPLAVPAQETTPPGQTVRDAATAVEGAAENAGEAAGNAAVTATTTTAEEAGTKVENAAENATTVVGLDGREFRMGGNTVLSSAVIGQPVMSSDGVEVGTVGNLILSLDGRVDGIVLNTGLLGIGGRNIAVGADRLLISDVVSGVPRLEITATKAAIEATPDFAPPATN
jgi:sporulation protein YlmC with PRC-barrel domain